MKKLLLAVLVLIGLQTQAQVSPCDSISYTITSSTNTNLLQLNGVITGVCPINFPCVVSDWSWQVCNNSLCFSDTGQVSYFQQFNTSDTIKVCLMTTIDYMGATYSCMSQCDSLVFGPNGWMLMNMGNSTGIEELTGGQIDDQIYDLLGRKLKEVPVGTMYIRNRKVYLKN
tara:strand:- start:12414 stop:12926 length:513 start_codon:yes stop_codon:yes gene_type:complete